MQEETGAPTTKKPLRSNPIRRPSPTARVLCIAALAAFGTAPTALAEEGPGAQAAQPCGACHDPSHFEGLRWDTYRTGLAGHPAANGIVAGLSEADRRAIARHFGIPGTPDAAADPGEESERR